MLLLFQLHHNLLLANRTILLKPLHMLLPPFPLLILFMKPKSSQPIFRLGAEDAEYCSLASWHVW